jgi:hypothetical protein
VITRLLVLTLVAACDGTPDVECDQDNPCSFGADCIDGVCVSGLCATSEQCPMEQHCEARQCVAGCTTDTDCYPGFECGDEGACVEAACVETKVDCGFREYCNTATGECYDAGGDFCRFCNDTAECEDGNECLGNYCSVDCSSGRECPSGFDCYGFVDQNGNVVYFGCYTYCWLYEGYEPGSFDRAPGPDGLRPVPASDLAGTSLAP